MKMMVNDKSIKYLIAASISKMGFLQESFYSSFSLEAGQYLCPILSNNQKCFSCLFKMIIHNDPSFNRQANHRMMIIVFSLQSSYKEDIVIT